MSGVTEILSIMQSLSSLISHHTHTVHRKPPFGASHLPPLNPTLPAPAGAPLRPRPLPPSPS